MTHTPNWRIDGRDIFIQDWKTDKEMTVKDAEHRLNSHAKLLEALEYALKTLQSQPNADDIAMYPLQSAITNAKGE